MSKHSADLARVPIKWVRDKAKARYQKGSSCEICGITENLDFHHYYTMTPLFDKWLKGKGYPVETDEDIIKIRDEFIEAESDKIYNETVTLCHDHHMSLHSVYGKNPTLVTAPKQKRWVGIQKEKYDTKNLDS